MNKFQQNTTIMSNQKESKKIVKSYNKIARALVEYETIWLNAWKASVNNCRAGLGATLIVRAEGRLYVNFDMEIFQLIRECKCLLLIGVKLPEASRMVLMQVCRGRVARGGGPRQQPAHPQYANYWAPLTRKRHTMPHSAQPQHANYWAPRTRKRHQQEHRPQRPTESSDPTQHAKGRTGDRPGPRKGATTRRNVTQGGGRAVCWAKTSTTPNTPTAGLRERGNDTSRSTGRSGRQKAATRRNMRREERVTVQGPAKKQQPDGMSRGGGSP